MVFLCVFSGGHGVRSDGWITAAEVRQEPMVEDDYINQQPSHCPGPRPTRGPPTDEKGRESGKHSLVRMLIANPVWQI